MIILVGESASGKTTIANNLSDTFGFKKIVTYTTRPKRTNEVDDVDYHFISENDFKELESSGFFAETAVYNGWYYGSKLADYGSKNENKISILTPAGLRQVKKKCSDVGFTSFYINVPRRERLMRALKRGDDIEEAYRRNLSDVGQFDGIENEVDFVIDNDNSFDVVFSIIKKYRGEC